MLEKYTDFTHENIAYWTTRAPGYSGVNQEELASNQRNVWNDVISGRIAEHFGSHIPRELKILDIGTGPGFFAIILAEQGYRVTAVDYTEAMLRQAQENAGKLADKINFFKMDAENLKFPDESFDVVVSRNLTWNLPHPDIAYAQWARVLKKGGLLLNFDANWYRYLYDGKAREFHLQDRENIVKSNANDETAGTDVAAMEAIALKAPLSARNRPVWDLEICSSLGMDASADEDVWRQVWTENERINNASTTMFLVRAVKND